MRDFKADYRDSLARFREASPDRLHFAAHSHHLWPDRTRDAHLRFWDDSARSADGKWGGPVAAELSRARESLAGLLGLRSAESIALAPNTHELVGRILSCFDPSKPLRVLTSDSEFHSFSRRLRRLEEEPGRVVVERVAAEPLDTFEARFKAACARGGHDLVFLSHVFFNSGYVVSDLGAIAAAVRDASTWVVFDGYHAFCAVPVDLSPVQDRVFYISGGYKYAQAGEGACFLHAPEGYGARPVDTGWFADFEGLPGPQAGQVGYDRGGLRFMGATFDPSGWYRFNAVVDGWKKAGVTVAELHAHSCALQARFVEGLAGAGHPRLKPELLLVPAASARVGNFLTFRLPDAVELARRLDGLGVTVDARGDRLRFGFGAYQDIADVDALLERLARL